ncbi:hypothetical protein GPECTOR_1g77 [Gonium pectorale]|uniref:Uncharacterized protein n=1 Tax=Gonium pectorale TaxID=33097 RepID=A0A150H462_GONPE|nr:hypothetical protein GPECTOR_1g77 [Gonium pectorale]|eukprot:KXZ56853.1 hypothetical protein GPECTOR_1g77 [Gonium pectorale]
MRPGSRTAEAATPCLSSHDQMALRWHSTGGSVLLRESIAAPLLKRALGEALATLPWLAGRLVLGKIQLLTTEQDGKAFDVTRCNSGARLVIASTSATLADVAAATAPGGGGVPYSTAAVSDPWAEHALPDDPSEIARQKSPLASVFLMHLSGGGCLLSLSVYHPLADFEALQTFAARLSASYNAALAAHHRRQGACADGTCGSGNDSSSILGSTGRPGPDATAPRAAGNGAGAAASATAADATALRSAPPAGVPRFDPAALEAHADPSPLPPAVAPLELDGWVPGSALEAARVVTKVLWQLVWRGGGIHARMHAIPAGKLAALKQRATAELAEERERLRLRQRNCWLPAAERQRQQERLVELEAAAAKRKVDGGGASAAEAATAGDPGSGGDAGLQGLECVEWVSTADALAARLMQVLHSLPLRRDCPLTAFVAANMRQRLDPPLPPGQLGNCLGSVCLLRLRPSQCSLGALAGQLRLGIQSHLLPRFRRSLHDFARLAARHGPASLMPRMALAADPWDNILAPEGPLVFSHWDVKYQLWQFGSEAPLAFLPLTKTGPNVIRYYPGPRAVLAALLAALFLRRQKRGPPGPFFTVPILGDTIEMAMTDPARFLFKRYKAYGSVFSLSLAGHPTAVVADWNVLKLPYRDEGAIPYVPFPAFRQLMVRGSTG